MITFCLYLAESYILLVLFESVAFEVIVSFGVDV